MLSGSKFFFLSFVSIFSVSNMLTQDLGSNTLFSSPKPKNNSAPAKKSPPKKMNVALLENGKQFPVIRN